MNEPISIDLGSVIDRAGKKIAARLITQQFGGQPEYAVMLGQSRAGGFLLPVLFDYVLSDGLSDFEITHDEWPELDARVPAGEIRALVRRLMGDHIVGGKRLTIDFDARVSLTTIELKPVDLPF